MVRKSILIIFVGSVLCFSWHLALFGADSITLRINKGDTLVGVSQKYLDNPGHWRAVAKTNGLKNPDLIYPGQELIIPAAMMKGTPQHGLVTFSKGKVAIKKPRSKVWEALETDKKTPQGSVIKTESDGAVEITFPDGSTLFQGPDTELGVAKSVQKGDNLFIKKFFLKIGKIVAKIRGATGANNRFEVDTPAATAVARGTQFRSSMDKKSAARFEVFEGVVGIRTPMRRVEAKENEGVLVNKGQAPSSPVKLLPPPLIDDQKSLYKKMPMKFKLISVAGAVSYRLTLFRDEACRDVLRSGIVDPGGFFEISELNDGTYYLQTTSTDMKGFEGASLKPLKIVVRTTPKAPYVQVPIQKGEYRGTAIEATWLKVPGAAAYDIQISKDVDFSVLVVEVRNTEKTTARIKLPDYRTYFFRIRSLAADGFESEWSDAVCFDISPLPPSPSMEKPQAGGKEIHIGWKDAGPGMKYHFQLSHAESFSEILIDKVLDKPGIVFPRPKESGSYYVRVSSIDQKGVEGDFSPPQVLEITKAFPYGILGVAGGVAVLVLLLL